MKMVGLLLSVGLLVSGAAQAGLVHSGLDSATDNQVTLHQETGLEWLKLGKTKGMSYSEVLSSIGKGGEFEGWRLPTHEELSVYLEKALGNINSLKEGRLEFYRPSNINDISIDSGRRAIRLLGFTTNSPYSTSGSAAGGLFVNESGEVRTSGLYVNGTHVYSGYARYDVRMSFDIDYSSASYGYFLVSDGGVSFGSLADPTINENNPNAPINDVTVPLMASLGLLVMGVTGLKRKQRKT
tara:strand:+ start:1591 stop:2310 length:720 start_codon:yes stop_codon:yes gene_type:complete